MLRTGLARENYARAPGRVSRPAPSLVACSLIALAPLALLDDRADLDLLDPELRRWIGLRARRRAARACSTTRSAAAPAADTPRGWRGHARAVLAGRLLDRGDQGASGRSRSPPTPSPGAGARGIDYLADLALLLLATNLFNLLDLRPGPGREGVRRCCSPASASAPGRSAPLELLGLFIGPVLVGAAFTLRERAMLGDTGSNLVGALAGISLLVVARRRRGRWIALAVVAALTIYGEFRSISRRSRRFRHFAG